jgi:hypothetical protein
VLCVLGAVRRTPPSKHTTVYWVQCGAQHPVNTLLYRLKHILPLHSYNFNDVCLLIISTKTVTLARFRRMLSDDGPSGPKHVEAI